MLILLKQYTGTDSRGIIELVDLMSKVKQALGLDQVPHFTILTVSIQHKQKSVDSFWLKLKISTKPVFQ